MKFILFLILFYFNSIYCQYHSLNLDSKPNDQFVMTPTSLYSPKSNTNMLKKLYSLVDTPKVMVQDLHPPQYPSNIKYTETQNDAIYYIELPHFPSFISKNDIIVEVGVAGVKITAKDSGLYHNDAFFPDLTENTLSSIVKGRDYELDLTFFRKLKSNESQIQIDISAKEGNSYEVKLTIDKNQLVDQPLLTKKNSSYTKFITTVINSDEKLKKMKELIKEPFGESNERILPDTGLKIEVFKKGGEDPVKEKTNRIEDLVKIMQDLKEGKDDQVKKTMDNVVEQSKDDVEKMKKEVYTESNMDKKMKEKQEKSKKEGEKAMKENIGKSNDMFNALDSEAEKEQKKENEEEYEYNL